MNINEENNNGSSGGRSGGGGRGSRPSRGRSGGYRGRYRSRRRVCVFCADKTAVIDWKKGDELRRFIGDSGEIYPRRKNGLCARHQRAIATAIKRARHLALLPFTSEHLRITRG